MFFFEFIVQKTFKKKMEKFQKFGGDFSTLGRELNRSSGQDSARAAKTIERVGHRSSGFVAKEKKI